MIFLPKASVNHDLRILAWFLTHSLFRHHIYSILIAICWFNCSTLLLVVVDNLILRLLWVYFISKYRKNRRRMVYLLHQLVLYLKPESCEDLKYKNRMTIANVLTFPHQFPKIINDSNLYNIYIVVGIINDLEVYINPMLFYGRVLCICLFWGPGKILEIISAYWDRIE